MKRKGNSMDRRMFIRTVAGSAVLSSMARAEWSLPKFLQDEDETICRHKFELAVSLELQKKPIGDAIVEIGKSFLGTPYLAHGIEAPGDEHLVVNMRGLDCVSFYENSLVLARCVKMNAMTFDDYKKQLTLIRYRTGVINGYPSRLHYTSDYFYEDAKKGIWKEMTRELGGEPFVKVINFMSTHAESYLQLKEHPEFIPIIKQQEEEITKREKFYIPKEKVAVLVDKLQNGDIIGTTTNIEGIDTSHTGILIWQDKQLHFMHAPLAGGKVEISDKPLPEYLGRNKGQTGIMVVRPLEPA